MLVQFRASRLTQRQFAEQCGLNPGTLRQWIHRFGAEPSPVEARPMGFQEVPLSAVLDSWAAELRLPSGIVLRLNGQASASWVGALVERLS
jgi:hypothetical protein